MPSADNALDHAFCYHSYGCLLFLFHRTERCLLPDGSLSPAMDTTMIAERFARRGYVVVMQVIKLMGI